MLSIVPVDWVIACMVPLYKGKGDVHVCGNFRGISLSSVVGKVYSWVLINRIRDNPFVSFNALFTSSIVISLSFSSPITGT